MNISNKCWNFNHRKHEKSRISLIFEIITQQPRRNRKTPGLSRKIQHWQPWLALYWQSDALNDGNPNLDYKFYTFWHSRAPLGAIIFYLFMKDCNEQNWSACGMWCIAFTMVPVTTITLFTMSDFHIMSKRYTIKYFWLPLFTEFTLFV